MLLIPFNKAIISRFIGLSAVTYFEIASRAILRLRAFWEHAIRAIMPEISRIKAQNKNSTYITNNILKKTFKIIFFTGFPAFLTLFFIAPLFFQFWLKGQFSLEIGIIFKILLIGYFINLISVPFYYYFMAIGKISYCFINHLCEALSNFLVISILVYICIYNLYIYSMVYSGAIAFGAITIILLFLKHKNFNFKKNKEIHQK
jgi:O-antigen/teichoic acid export membrane protein